MSRYFLYILLMTGLSIPAKAQLFPLSSKPPFNSQLLVIADTTVLISPESRRVIEWTTLDSNLTEISRNRIGLMDPGRNGITDFLVMNNQVLYIEQVRNKKTRTVYLSKLDASGGHAGTTREISPGSILEQRAYNDTAAFSLLLSGDRKYLLFYQFRSDKYSFSLSGFILNEMLEVVQTCYFSDSRLQDADDFNLQSVEGSGRFYLFKYDYESNYRMSTRLSAWQIDPAISRTRSAQMFVREFKLSNIRVSEWGDQICLSALSKTNINAQHEGIVVIRYNSDFSDKGSLYHFVLDEKTAKLVRKTLKPEVNTGIYEYFTVDQVQPEGKDRFRVWGSFFKPRLLITDEPLDTNVNTRYSIARKGLWRDIPFRESLPDAGNVAFMENQLRGDFPKKYTLIPVYDYVLVDAVASNGILTPRDEETALRNQASNYNYWVDSYFRTYQEGQPAYYTYERKNKLFGLDKNRTGETEKNLLQDKNHLLTLNYPLALHRNSLVCFYLDAREKKYGLIRIRL